MPLDELAPCGISARTSVGESPRIDDALLLDEPPEAVGAGQSGAPSAKTIVQPRAPPPTTSTGP